MFFYEFTLTTEAIKEQLENSISGEIEITDAVIEEDGTLTISCISVDSE